MFCTQVKKALELYEQLRQRMGVVVVGPSGSGKSTLWTTLRLALAKIGQVVKKYVMNPKAMPRQQVCDKINTLWPSDSTWWHRSGSTLVQVMTATGHYLNQCWNIVNWILIRNKIQWNLNCIHTISLEKMHLKMSCAKWQPFCLSRNMLMQNYLLYSMLAMDILLFCTNWTLNMFISTVARSDWHGHSWMEWWGSHICCQTSDQRAHRLVIA